MSTTNQVAESDAVDQIAEAMFDVAEERLRLQREDDRNRLLIARLQAEIALLRFDLHNTSFRVPPSVGSP